MRNIRANGGYGNGELNKPTSSPVRETGISYFPNFNATSNGNGSTIPNGNGSTIPNGSNLNNGANNFGNGNGNGNGNGDKIVNGGNRIQIIQDCQIAALVPEDRSKCIGTTDGGFDDTHDPGIGGDMIASATVFPAGTVLYGRWTGVDLAAGVAVLYLGA